MRVYRNLTFLAIILSLAIHLIFGLGLHLSPQFAPQKDVPEQIELIVWDTSEEGTKGQIVDQNKTALNDEVPEDSRFLSRHNQRVVKETRARNSGKFQNNAGQGIAPKAQSSQPSKPKTNSSLTAPKGLPTLADLKPRFNWEKLEQESEKAGVNRPGPKSQSSDYLKDIEAGEQTILSTREFVYFTYYSRIKSKIQQYWEPSIKEKVRLLFKQGRKIASVDRKTRLLIVLDQSGTLVGVKVLGQSGIEDLDDAAIDAFQDAAPFPNPPAGLLEKDGTVKIRWDFILEA